MQRDSTNAATQLHQVIDRGERLITVNGLTSTAAKALVFADLKPADESTILIVADTNAEVDQWARDLNFWSEKGGLSRRVIALPSFESDFYSGVSPHAETLERRALALWQLTRQRPDIVVTSARGFASKLIEPERFAKLCTTLILDRDTEHEKLIDLLLATGYVMEDPIANYGQFSVRGGIMDIWPPTSGNPVRIEFFGDTVDAIREFDAETQLSTGQLKEVAIPPMREFYASQKDLKDWAFFAREHFTDDKFARNLKDRTDFADEGETFSGWEFLLPLTSPLDATIFDYLDGHLLVIDEPVVVEQTISEFFSSCEKKYETTIEHGDIALEPASYLISAETLRQKIDAAQRVELRGLGKTAAAFDEDFNLNV